MHPWAALNSLTDLRVTLSNVLCLDFNHFPQFQTYMHTFKGRNVVWHRWQSMTCAILIWMHHNASSCFIAPWHWATGFSPALKKQAGCIMMYHPHHPFVLVLSCLVWLRRPQQAPKQAQQPQHQSWLPPCRTVQNWWRFWWILNSIW